jgi:hypothetical protein
MAIRKSKIRSSKTYHILNLDKIKWVSTSTPMVKFEENNYGN